MEREIVDYAIVVLLEPELSEMKGGYQYRMVTDQTSFHYVLTLLIISRQGIRSGRGCKFFCVYE